MLKWVGVISCNCTNPLGSLVPSIYMLLVYSDSFHFAFMIPLLLCSWIHQRRHFAVTVYPASRLMACAVWLSAHNAVARVVDAKPGGSALLRVTAALEPLHPRVYPAMTPGWHLASLTVVGVMYVVLSIRDNSIPDSWDWCPFSPLNVLTQLHPVHEKRKKIVNGNVQTVIPSPLCLFRWSCIVRAPYRVHSVRNLAFATPMSFVCGLDEVCGPALTITLEWSESLTDLDLAVTEPDGTLVRFSNMVGVSKSSNDAVWSISIFCRGVSAVLTLSRSRSNGWNPSFMTLI